MTCERRGCEQTICQDPTAAVNVTTRQSSHAAGSRRPRAAERLTNAALCWALIFTAMHVYWYLGGRVGFGDQPDPLPAAPSSLGDWIFTIVVGGMFAAGLMVPIAFTRTWGRHVPRRLLVWSMWAGCLVLIARGGFGQLDDGLRFTGLRDGGLTGLSTEDVIGSAHPSTYTKVSTVAVDAVLLIGGILFGCAARVGRSPHTATAGPAPDRTLDAAAGTERAERLRGVAERPR